MGETGEDGLQPHEDQEPFRLRRELECHSQHGATRTAVLPVRRDRAQPAISLDMRSCQMRVYADGSHAFS
jgi:hypothetical protein